MSAHEPNPATRERLARAVAFETLYGALRAAREGIEPWEHDALRISLDALAAQSPQAARDRECHGFVR